MTAPVRDRRPPAALIRVLNPIMRAVLPTPLGRAVRPFALLDFTGRRTGHRFRVAVGWHPTGDGPIVVTPAGWRANFAGGRAATVHHRGRAQHLTGELITEPSEVAFILNDLFDHGTPPGRIGVDVPAGHTFDADDVLLVDRAVIRFR